MADEIVRDGTGRALGRIYHLGPDRYLRDMNGRLLGRESARGTTWNAEGKKVGEHLLEALLDPFGDEVD